MVVVSVNMAATKSKVETNIKNSEELLDDLISGKEIPFSEAKEEGEHVVSQAKEKAERLLEDVDSLISQIKDSEKEKNN